MGLLTEQRLVVRPAVYGFLRPGRASAARRTALRQALAVYCSARELALVDVFTEHDSAPGTEGAFARLLDALATGAYGVVLPSPAHLGPRGQVTVRRTQVAGTGARILALRDDEHPHSGPSGRVPAPRRCADLPPLPVSGGRSQEGSW
ncbi:hypothetical protein ACFVIM_08145 [Streptomyces sp. NPDC057638]|uniref:hypothetical protein n=1 Tax=Streptomyces sp. NPDC057638 TaxID=3346190 RepID=UPI0036ACFD6B